jgi:ATP-dependent helicase/nuclease subunit B
LSDSQQDLHFNDLRWQTWVTHVQRLLAERDGHPSQCVILVPYAQLMAVARQAWVKCTAPGAAAYVPRIETTQNWALSLWAARGGFVPSPDDLTQDAAADQFTAQQFLVRAGLQRQVDVLSPRLMEAAWSLARCAAAVAPDERSAWQARVLPQLTADMETDALALEAALAQLALAWAASSRYVTDILFEQRPGLLVVLQGWQSDLLAQALQGQWEPNALSVPWPPAPIPQGQIHLQPAADREEEAQRAAACLIERLSEGLQPVGLIAQDRALTRRIRAIVSAQQVAIRDETGWTLSTTHAAATVMAALRAVAPAASSDEVLAWLKLGAAIDGRQLLEAEAQLRKAGVRRWADITPALTAAFELTRALAPWLEPMRAHRSLSQWLAGLRQLLGRSGQWEGLLADAAGQAVMDALGLEQDDTSAFDGQSQRMTLSAFTRWVGVCLESALFQPVHPAQAQVVVLPLAQLMGRSLAALVLPGADERHLPASPAPPPPWNARQRQLLGLPSRESLMAGVRQAWSEVLGHSRVDVFWRQSENGEALMPSTLVQALMLEGAGTSGQDARHLRVVAVTAARPAQASGARLPILQLSASAYDDLRTCPYRFFALRQLGLRDDEEIESPLDRRDIGNWLHATLRDFHESLRRTPTSSKDERVGLFDDAARRALSAAVLDAAEFLPYAASLPGLRDGYLNWLQDHELAGHGFDQAEQWRERLLGHIKLVGQIDRIDRDAQGQAVLIDYKSESVEKTRARLKKPEEDTQLAFYAALLAEEAVEAAYLSLGERGQTEAFRLPDLPALRDQLLAAVQKDLSRLEAGHDLLALGEGQACTHCQARGLCRRDFVSPEDLK